MLCQRLFALLGVCLRLLQHGIPLFACGLHRPLCLLGRLAANLFDVRVRVAFGFGDQLVRLLSGGSFAVVCLLLCQTHGLQCLFSHFFASHLLDQQSTLTKSQIMTNGHKCCFYYNTIP